MVSIWGSAVIAGSFLGVLETATGSPASAFDRRIELTNNTRMAIVEIQIAHVGTGRWERDLLNATSCFLPNLYLSTSVMRTAPADSISKRYLTMGTARFSATSMFALWRGLPSPIDSSRPRHRAVAY
jgi:hypothetical protein